MEEIQNFYLSIIAQLKELQSNRLYNEKIRPIRFDVHEKFTETWKARSLAKKSEKQRVKLENGYYKGINDCIKKIEKTYKEILKCYSKD